MGQPIVIVAARNRQAVARARDAVRIDVREQTPLLSLDEAIRRKTFLGPARQITRGSFAEAWPKAKHRIRGTFRCGGQEQFYLENQSAIAYPEDNGRIVVHSSTQNPTEIQSVVAEVLGLGQHQVVCICKRMGGAFGGKETQATIPALMVSLVAQKTGCAARLVLNKDDDLKITGKRHPYVTNYQVGFDDQGVIRAACFDFSSDGGAFADLSTSVHERTMLHADNAYYLPHVQINAQVYRTNYPPNTAFRGFGGPQGMLAIENAIQEIAIELGQDAAEIRRRNCYGTDQRNTTPYGQIVEHNLLPEIFARLLKTSDYAARLEAIQVFNRQSQTHLRGIAITPVKFGISFTTKCLNQGNALVLVFSDGTVQVSTGATEMGQGVNIKIAQLVADELGVPINAVSVMDTSTEKNNNTSPTAASASTDLNGTAAVRAAHQIRERLAELAVGILSDVDRGLDRSVSCIRFADGSVFDRRRPKEKMEFADLAALARRERVDLGARGFHATPGVDFNRETGKGHPFFYFTTGAAVSEVVIDRFTGELAMRRADLLIELGQRINPEIERGQVIGGFIQGMGYVTAEELSTTSRVVCCRILRRPTRFPT